MIHICFSLYDKTGGFSKFIGTAMLSIFENINPSLPLPSVTIHILHDNTLTQDNYNKFSYLAKQYKQSVMFYNVEKLCADRIAKIRELFLNVDESVFTIGTTYRFLIPHVFSTDIKKVIYLDADVIVNLDINELWQIKMKHHPLFAVTEIDNGIVSSIYSGLCREGIVKEENYFNAGILVMNLEVLRNEEENILAGIKFIGEHPEYNYFDQDVLNYCFENQTLRLPVKFNHLVKQMRMDGLFFVEREIYHYAGGKVGLGVDIGDPFNRLWWSYFIQTPWFSVDTIDKILKNTQNSILQFYSIPSSKSRVFVVDEEHAYQIERNFFVRYEEEVIIVDSTINEEYWQKLTTLINEARDKKVFFIGIQSIASKLEKIGFIEGRDFFNVSAFYSPVWANLINNRNLILSI